MLKKGFLVIGILVLIFMGLFLGKYLYFKNMSFPMPGPSTVSTAVVERVDWQPRIHAIGTVRAAFGVDISSEVSGTVRKILFKSGEDVTQGEELLKLDSVVLNAALARDEANLKIAQITHHRNQAVYKNEGVSAAALDQGRANLNEAKALKDETAAVLDQKTIRAPFLGRVGIRQVELGQYINPGQTIVSIQRLDPLLVDFNVPERYITSLTVGQLIRVSKYSDKGSTFQGSITALDSRIDAQTHSLKLRAEIPNPKHELLPGMFMNVEVSLPVQKKMLIVPQSSIDYQLYGTSVFVVREGVVKRKYVTVGDRFADSAVISEGLHEGDVIVTAGINKLRDGSAVAVEEKKTSKSLDKE